MYPNQKFIKSKIIATLGPASNEEDQIRSLIRAGMDCARINFSHGTAEDKKQLFARIRELDPELAILCDIQGPKIRIGRIKDGGVALVRGQDLVVTSEDLIGDEAKITITYDDLAKEVRPGELIYINDGIVCLSVKEIRGKEIQTKVLAGGRISSCKGVNLPSTRLSTKVPTKKDIQDLQLIAELDPEFVAVSFVGDAADLEATRSILSAYGNKNIKLIAKIERPVAIKNFDAILNAADGVMVARGDLGVELPPEEVPALQKEMIKKCNIVGKPVIVATQMLESMVKAPVPTRAEVSDVYNAISQGADAVMLSAETASGDYPEEAVTIMARIISSSENQMPLRDPRDYDSSGETISEIIGHLTFSACQELHAKGIKKGKIICITKSGFSARMISKYRPNLPIYGITTDLRTARLMRITWGVMPLLIPDLERKQRLRTLMEVAVERCLEKAWIERDEQLVLVGDLFNLPHKTNSMSLVQAGQLLQKD